MGEANRWQDAFSQALREQAILVMGLIKKVSELEKKLNEISKADPSGQEIIHGISGAQYVAQVYKGPDGVPHKKYPDSEEQQ